MNQEQFEKAKLITEKKNKLEVELRIWQYELVSPCYLAHKMPVYGHLECINSNMNKELFMAFRQSVINDLECQIMRLDAEFSEI